MERCLSAVAKTRAALGGQQERVEHRFSGAVGLKGKEKAALSRRGLSGAQVARRVAARYLACLANENSSSEQNSRVPASRRFFRQVKSIALTPEAIYRFSLKMKFGAAKLTRAPGPNIVNGTLKTRAEWEQAFQHGKRLHVPLHRGPEKNWDHLAAVTTILANTKPNARILDAGAEIYSNVLPALFLYGYRDLHGINLSFTAPTRRGPIRYIPGDLTRTPYPGSSFDAITCMSVIEHGVPLREYFREMFRLLKPGGLLITSTDYFPTPIETRGQVAHDMPIKIFSKPEIEAAIELAKREGFEQTGPIDLDCDEKPIHWEQFGLDYTFVLFTLKKPTSRPD
jgi:SAM-dependent methyltransferase